MRRRLIVLTGLVMCQAFVTHPTWHAYYNRLRAVPNGGADAATSVATVQHDAGDDRNSDSASIQTHSSADISIKESEFVETLSWNETQHELLDLMEEKGTPNELSRRDWFRLQAAMATTVMVGGAATSIHNQINKVVSNPVKQRLAPINLTQIARETMINVSMECTTTCVSLDRNTFQKKVTLKLPAWMPQFLVPPPRVVKDIPNSELLAAAILAGSTMEMARTVILYPLLTLKTRIQTDIRTRHARRRNQRLHPKQRLLVLRLNARRHFREGKLYAGIVPSMLVPVPAMGVFYGVRDVVRRMLTPLPFDNDIAIAVTAALVADVVSLAIRTPVDALAIRLQKATGEEERIRFQQLQMNQTVMTEEEEQAAVQEKVGNWFVESIERLPAVILTDLPYLLSRIALNRALIHGVIDIGHYELTAISTALICGFLTTPFDVARTRILVDSDSDPTNGIDGGSGQGLMRTFQTIMREGNGGVSNLFAGWFERTLYLGIGRAWLEPLSIVGYIAIRDAILLEWFD